MGIIDFVKHGVQEMMIARPDDKKDLIVYKHPDRNIPMHSQLTVDADEAAVFFRDGSVVGVLRSAGAGQRHTLSSQNIPFLNGLVDKFTGGNLFVTDLFFVTMRPIYDVRFGGELGYMEDPMLGEMVTPRIFGSFAFQILDPAKFIVSYVGVRTPKGNDEITKWMKGLFMNAVKTVVGEVCVSEQKSILQLMPLQSQLAQYFEQHCPDLNDIGVRIGQVGQFNINLTPEDEETLKAAQSEIGKAKRAARVAQIGISEAEAKAQQKQFELNQQFQQDSRYVKGLAGGSFGQFAAGKAMMGAGEGMAKGGGGTGGGPMMAGAGFGMGMGMGNAFAQGMQPGQQPAQQPAPQAPVAPGGTVTCPSCHAQVAGGKFCTECGAGLAPHPHYCPSCGAEGPPGAKFCAECGTAYPA